MPKPYRTRVRLTLDVLAAIQREDDLEGRALVTRLLALANLTHPRLVEHLQHLVAKGWVTEEALGPRKGWHITVAGRAALVELRRIEGALQDFGMAL